MMTPTCPFCGIVTDVAHETQQACIDALQEEIARVRGILDHSQRPGDNPPENKDAAASESEQ